MVTNTQGISKNVALQTQLCKTTHIGCQQTVPILLAEEPQGRLNNTLASASIHLARATINTYCLGIGTEGLLGDLRVLASIEVKRKVCIPQNIWKRDTGFTLCM